MTSHGPDGHATEESCHAPTRSQRRQAVECGEGWSGRPCHGRGQATRLRVANAATRWSAAKDGWYQAVHHLAMVATKRVAKKKVAKSGYVESPARECMAGTAMPRKRSGDAPACSQRRQAVECGEGWSVPGRPPSGDGGYEEVGYEEVGDDEGRYEEGRDEVIGYEESS